MVKLHTIHRENFFFKKRIIESVDFSQLMDNIAVKAVSSTTTHQCLIVVFPHFFLYLKNVFLNYHLSFLPTVYVIGLYCIL